ncbi:hypothetical protein MYX78_04275 [Acidobacteria bacterium AH-259-G07]|nr:hypothetical protein [Acidobacteria bacterium AH-259-G07]
MGGPELIWRLEGGYSRFIEGSRVELRLEKGPIRQSLDVFPSGLVDRSKPIDLIFRAAQGFSGQGPGKVRWSLRPEGSVRALILFSGNAFLGNFRVPADHFAIQWDLQVSAEGTVGNTRGPLLVGINAKTRLYHSWVTVFPHDTSIVEALHEAWRSYRYPLDPADVFRMPERQVVRWRWNGRVRLGIGIEWALAMGWAIPGTVPMVDLRKELASGPVLRARFQAVEEGQFAIQLRKRAAKIEFRLRRYRQRVKQASLYAGAHLGSRVRIVHLGPTPRGALRILSRGLSQPLRRKMNRVLKQALVRHLEIALALEKMRWKRSATMLAASWSKPDAETFRKTYSQLVGGSLPASETGMELAGRFERVRGQRVTVRFNVLNWIGIHKSRQRQSRQALIVGPAGDIIFEEAEELEKTRYRWDEIQFLRLLHRETIRETGHSREFFWSYGQHKEFSHHALRQLLKMALHLGMLREFSLPARSTFPLAVQLLLATRFSPEGLAQVRQASREEKWRALVRALELAEPDRYGKRTFWRDWIDSPEVREKVDGDPVQTHLATRYPVGGRSEFQRRQVVAAYRRSKRFLALLEGWREGEHKKVLKAFSLGLDVPIFVFFHLLCPLKLRRSAAVITGEWEQAWGETELLEQLTSDS